MEHFMKNTLKCTPTKGIWFHSQRPKGVITAVLATAIGPMGIWLYPDCKSMTLNTLHPVKLVYTLLIRGIG